MKSIKEIQEMLVSELLKSLVNVNKSLKLNLGYYNETLGDSSFLLAGLLGQILKKRYNDWDIRKWMDDCLLTNIKLNNNILSISGVMIWGIENMSEQWTEPFYFEMKLNHDQTDFIKYTFLFSDLDNTEISYDEYRHNRSYWKSLLERNWKYIINIER